MLAAVIIQNSQGVSVEALAQADHQGQDSICGQDLVVFARNVHFDSRAVFIDLPAGIYKATVTAPGIVDLGQVGQYRPVSRKLSIGVKGWRPTFQEADRYSDWFSMAREVVRNETVFSGLVSTPGGVARFSISISFGGRDEYPTASAPWRWEIIAPGVCEMPPEMLSDD